jgi:predicted nucleic acid-binding protein
MPVLLDTTVLIDVLRGGPTAERVRASARRGERLFTCAVSVDELVRGIRLGEERQAQRLLDGLRSAPLGRAEGERAGTWRREFAERGVTLTQADCLIAASAVGVGARLATPNVADFPMPELVVEPWPSP